MSVGTTLSHLHESTAALSATVLDDIGEVIYTMRDGELSVCVVASKLETLARMPLTCKASAQIHFVYT